METPNCGACGKQMKYVPAGVSKKNGKPYNAFYACDSRDGGCGKTMPAAFQPTAPQHQEEEVRQFRGGMGRRAEDQRDILGEMYLLIQEMAVKINHIDKYVSAAEFAKLKAEKDAIEAILPPRTKKSEGEETWEKAIN